MLFELGLEAQNTVVGSTARNWSPNWSLQNKLRQLHYTTLGNISLRIL
jgi:hypothetical protein